MSVAFFTTRTGCFESINLFKYIFTERILTDKSKHDKLKTWLLRKSDFLVYDVEDTCFFTFRQLDDEYTNQYKRRGLKTISAPFSNTQLISNYISALLKGKLSDHYEQFLNQNIFRVATVEVSPFRLLKAFEFNIEVFPSGHYLIHVLPTSKIIANTNGVTKKYILDLKNTLGIDNMSNEMEFNLVNTQKYYRLKINLADENLGKKLDEIFADDANFIATFDYHFLSAYSPGIFRTIIENTLKNLKQTVLFLNPVLEKFELPDFMGLSSDKFLKADVEDFGNKNNLWVGSKSETITLQSAKQTSYGIRLEYTRDDFDPEEVIAIFPKNETIIEQLCHCSFPKTLKAVVEKKEGWKYPYVTKLFINEEDKYTKAKKQSASYYNGIYKPVSDLNLLPIVYNNMDISLFNELAGAFNSGASNFKILAPVFIQQNEEISKELLLETIGNESGNTVTALFCKHRMTNDFLKPLKNFRYQIYQGETTDNKQNRAKLSNFVCKCLEKAGGIVAAVADLHLPDDGYFIGIDLGHTTVGTGKYSNMAAVIFNNHGILLGKSIVKKIPLKENLEAVHCTQLLRKISGILQQKNLPVPKHIIIHRDGKLHSNDVLSLANSIQTVWGNIETDIVEIIKSGFPVMAMKTDNSTVINPESGSAYIDEAHRYAIVVTNVQADEYGAILKPVIVKHKHGNSSFHDIIDQTYWLTLVYTSNLYNSTRLPATTLKANNIVGTSSKKHLATYLG